MRNLDIQDSRAKLFEYAESHELSPGGIAALGMSEKES
jgi:hypothetical protein